MMDFQAPTGWTISTLGEITEHQKGKVPKEFSAKLAPGFVPYIDIEAFETGNIRRFATTKKTTLSTEEDVLVVWDGARFGLVGKFSEGALGSTLMRLTSQVVERDYLLYFIRLHYETINARPRGTGTPHIEPDVFWSLEVGVPPRNEQRRIVEKIETFFAQLDKGEDLLREVQRQLKQYRQLLLNAAVTGKLTANWRTENADKLEHGRDLLQRILQARRDNWQGRGKYKEPTPPNTSDLPKLPEGWVWASIGQLALVETGATPKKGKSEYYSGGRIPWITSTSVNEDTIKYSQSYITQKAIMETNAKVFPEGTLIVAMYGEGKTRGMISELAIKAATNQACAAILVDHIPTITKKFIRYFFENNYKKTRLLSSGGVQPNMNLGIVRAMPIPLPPLEEQEAIVGRMSLGVQSIKHSEQAIFVETNRCATLRKLVLSSAFAGRLVPQDPNDDPAFELLDAIKVFRDKKPPKRTGGNNQ